MRNLRYLFFLVVIFFYFSNSLLSEQKYISIDKSYITSINKQYYMVTEFKLDNSGYIYGNPKGPGTGKDTNLYFSNIDIKDVYFSKPQKYYPESSPKWVWRYKNKFKVIVSLNSLPKEEIVIKTDALFCVNGACYPVKDDFIIKPDVINIIAGSNIDLNEFNKINIMKSDNKSISKSSNITSDFNPISYENNSVTNIIAAILFGLLAGLILNVMPCVLPVISLKIFTFIKNADEDKKRIRLSGLLYSAGIVLSFVLLASLLAFAGYNWGGLFQNTLFLKVMIILLFAFALSFFGIYTLNIPSIISKTASKKRSSIYVEAFIHGILATLLATPCSGPFLGATLSWTLTQSPLIIYTIFIFIGIGMSLPYIVLTMNTSLMKYIPKPGKWMVNFERIMGFLLIAAVIYFLTILNYNQIKIVLWMILIIAAALWQYGKYGSPVSKKKNRIISLFVLVLMVFIAFTIPGKIYEEKIINLDRENYSYSKLMALSEKQPVLIQFTADWCTNCKIIESSVYNTEEMNLLQKEYNLKILKADLDKSPGAEDLLKKLGSRSVPFAAVFYNYNFEQPYILRDIYEIDDIKKVLELINTDSKELDIQTINFE